MKKTKLFIVFLAILFLSVSLNGQETVSPFSYGLHLGPSFSGFTHHCEVFTLKKTGLNAGLFAEYKVLNFLAVSIEANYLMEGAFHVSPYLIYPESNISYSGGMIYKSSSDVTLHNINLPLLIKFRPVSLTQASPYLAIGYSLDFLISARSRDMIMASGTHETPLSDRSYENVTGSFMGWNHGPVAGIGMEFTGGKLKYAIEARYKVGLLYINDLAGLNTMNGQYDFSVNTFTVNIIVSK